jgi:hypothetical protein
VRLHRLTVRRMMILVVVVALAVWVAKLCWLSIVYLQRARAYADTVTPYMISGPIEHPWGPPLSGHDLWASEMANKYHNAARHPWLAVEPDPPEPK